MKAFLVITCALAVFYTVSCHPAAGTSRCVNVWDDGCSNGQLPGAGDDDDYLNGGFNPGKRCIDSWDESCGNAHQDNLGSDLRGFAPEKSLEQVLAKLINLRRHH